MIAETLAVSSPRMTSPAPDEASVPARASGTFAIGGVVSVHRLGFGAMRLPGIRGEPRSPRAAREILREAVRLGVDLIDTAQVYGRSEDLIADALHPYPEGLVIATKGGLRRGGHPDGRPERLRADCEDSLRRLRLDTIDLWQLHRIDPEVPVEDQFGAIRELRDEGKIRFVGVSERRGLRAARLLLPQRGIWPAAPFHPLSDSLDDKQARRRSQVRAPSSRTCAPPRAAGRICDRSGRRSAR
jgi:diketogulonate reductase-like aldo/keto reductase